MLYSQKMLTRLRFCLLFFFFFFFRKNQSLWNCTVFFGSSHHTTMFEASKLDRTFHWILAVKWFPQRCSKIDRFSTCILAVGYTDLPILINSANLWAFRGHSLEEKKTVHNIMTFSLSHQDSNTNYSLSSFVSVNIPQLFSNFFASSLSSLIICIHLKMLMPLLRINLCSSSLSILSLCLYSSRFFLNTFFFMYSPLKHFPCNFVNHILSFSGFSIAPVLANSHLADYLSIYFSYLFI